MLWALLNSETSFFCKFMESIGNARGFWQECLGSIPGQTRNNVYIVTKSIWFWRTGQMVATRYTFFSLFINVIARKRIDFCLHRYGKNHTANVNVTVTDQTKWSGDKFGFQFREDLIVAPSIHQRVFAPLSGSTSTAHVWYSAHQSEVGQIHSSAEEAFQQIKRRLIFLYPQQATRNPCWSTWQSSWGCNFSTFHSCFNAW